MTADGRQGVLERRAILVTGILVVIVGFLLPQTGDDFAENAPPSSFLVASGGARALYLTAQQVGLDVEQWMRPSAELLGPAAPDHLVVLAPSTRYAEADAAAILAWAAAGRRTLVYVPPRRPGDPLLSELGVDFEPGGRDRDSRPQVALRPAANVPDRLRPVVADVAMSVEGVRGRFDLAGHNADDAAPLLVDAAGHVGAALLQVGETSMLLLADHAGFSNGDLAESELALLVLRFLAEHAGTQTVWFDEYHHGFVEGTGVVAATGQWLVGTDVGRALLGLVVIGVAALVVAGTRFGDPVPIPPPPGRSSLEHVQALGTAYLEVGARARCQSLLLDGLRLEIGERTYDDQLEGLVAADPSLTRDLERIRAAGHTDSPAAAGDLVAVAGSVDRPLAARGASPASHRDR